MVDNVIQGGWVVTPHSEGHLDIGISGEQIAYVSSPGAVPVPVGAAVIDATGRVVTPGGIESHAHIHEPMYRGWTGGEEVWLQPPEGPPGRQPTAARPRCCRSRSWTCT